MRILILFNQMQRYGARYAKLMYRFRKLFLVAQKLNRIYTALIVAKATGGFFYGNKCKNIWQYFRPVSTPF